MSDADDDHDDRVSGSEQISLKRDPGLPSELLNGPFRYLQNEQEMWRALGMAALRKDDQDEMLIVAKIIAVAETSEDQLSIDMDDSELVVDADSLDESVRVGIVDGEPFVEPDN